MHPGAFRGLIASAENCIDIAAGLVIVSNHSNLLASIAAWSNFPK